MVPVFLPENLLLNAFSLERRVEFCETDSAGIAHFSSLAVYMEQAEHALFRSLGLSVFPQRNSAPPVVPNVRDSASHASHSALRGYDHPVENGADSDDHDLELSDPLDVTWPRVHIRLDFLGPARFEETLRIEVVVAKLGDSSVTFEHTIHGPKHPVARGTSISVCCKLDRSGSHELIKQSIPQPIRDKLKTFLRP